MIAACGIPICVAELGEALLKRMPYPADAIDVDVAS
jgi:hypothetical protein